MREKQIRHYIIFSIIELFLFLIFFLASEIFTLGKIPQLSADYHARWPPCKLWEHRFSDQISSLPLREARNTCERKQAKWRECLPRERLIQGEKHAGKEALLGVLDPTFKVSKTLQQRNTITKSAGTKKLKAMNMLKQRPRPQVPVIALFHCTHYRAFSHDVTAAILVFQNNETAAMLVYQENPRGV